MGFDMARRSWSREFVESLLVRRANGEQVASIAADIGTSPDNLSKAFKRYADGVQPLADHGSSSTPVYRVWTAMKQRCTNKNDPAYARYGGRGIDVCGRWLESFAAFATDMGARPPGGMLERNDNDRGYSPDNCRWATNHEQQRNRSGNVHVTWGGKDWILADLCNELNLTPTHVYWFTKRGHTVESAIAGMLARKERRDAKNQ